jgi:hypothetical protein
VCRELLRSGGPPAAAERASRFEPSAELAGRRGCRNRQQYWEEAWRRLLALPCKVGVEDLVWENGHPFFNEGWVEGNCRHYSTYVLL